MSNRKMLTDCLDLMKQWDYNKNQGVDPASLSAGSGYKAWWICEKGHSWQATVNHRHHGTGCPVCANRVVLKGFNDLKTVNPALAAQWNYERNGTLTPEDVPEGSHLKVWWRCLKGHEWQAVIFSRRDGYGCPYCAGQKPIRGETDFASVYPELSLEWDYEKNRGLTPNDICYGSNKKYWWKCKKGHSWQAIAGSRKRAGCPVCAGKKVLAGYNDLQTVNPKLANEWNYDENSITPAQVTAGSSMSVWWKCEDGHSWRAIIANRSGLGRGCPYCSGHLVISGENDLATLNPALSEEWHYEKNYPLKPEDVTANTTRKVWWKCKSGHEWLANIQLRNRGSGCPYCAGQRVMPGENDLLSVNPVLAKQWDYEKNSTGPEMVHSSSNQYAWWICEKGHSWRAIISNRSGLGRGCPYCSGYLAIPGETDLFTLHPLLAQQWDYEKNSLNIHRTTECCTSNVWWRCNKGHSWQATVYSRRNGNGCPYCSGLKAIPGETDLLTVAPHLAAEWDYERNTVAITDISFKSNVKVWWVCAFGHKWKATVCNRAIGKGCPRCAGKVTYSGKNVRR